MVAVIDIEYDKGSYFEVDMHTKKHTGKNEESRSRKGINFATAMQMND